jgi:hypothetical protein
VQYVEWWLGVARVVVVLVVVLVVVVVVVSGC